MTEVQALQAQLSYQANERLVGQICKVLIEGTSKRSEDFVYGRNSQNVTTIFPKDNYKPGDYVNVKLLDLRVRH